MEWLYNIYEKIKFFFTFLGYASLAAEFPEIFDELVENGHIKF